MDGSYNEKHTQIPVLAVVGPTASGKTALAIALAQIFSGEIVSCDSMQIYRGMDIGTAKPTAAELAAVPHHLVGFLEPTDPFSVSDYVSAAAPLLKDISGRGKLPILCGGTGLYSRSLLRGLPFDEFGRDDALREQFRQEADATGTEALYQELQRLDPEAAQKIHPNNHPRLFRALEYCRLSGHKFSDWQKKAAATVSEYDVCWLGIGFHDRDVLYERIDRRVDEMFRMGLEAEAREYYEKYRFSGVTSVQAIGYKELFPYFEGECTRQEAVERICRETRRYAKRQLTWFKREEGMHWVYGDEETPLLEQSLPVVRRWRGGEET